MAIDDHPRYAAWTRALRTLSIANERLREAKRYNLPEEEEIRAIVQQAFFEFGRISAELQTFRIDDEDTPQTKEAVNQT
jgi:hypothetical protein